MFIKSIDLKTKQTLKNINLSHYKKMKMLKRINVLCTVGTLSLLFSIIFCPKHAPSFHWTVNKIKEKHPEATGSAFVAQKIRTYQATVKDSKLYQSIKKWCVITCYIIQFVLCNCTKSVINNQSIKEIVLRQKPATNGESWQQYHH